MKSFLPILKRFWIIWLILVVIIFGLGSLALGEFQRWQQIKEDIARTEQDIGLTEKRLAELSGSIELISDPVYLEKEARRNLNVKREGEEVFAVVGLEEIKKEENFTLVPEKRIEERNEMWENVKSWYLFFFH